MSEQLHQDVLKRNGSGPARIYKALLCSFKGLKAAFTHEAAFRQELLLCLLLFPFSFVVASSLAHWVALISSLLFLLFAEIVNSAIESLADRISTENHELIGRAKDMGSAAVFFAILLITLVWLASLYQFLAR